MKEEEVRKLLIPYETIDLTMRQHFGNASSDPDAALLAVHDFESFVRVIDRYKRRIRQDRLRRLYQLYLSISRKRVKLSRENLEGFRREVFGYEKTSFFYFLKDIDILCRAGVIIVSTPILDAIEDVARAKATIQSLRRTAGFTKSQQEVDSAIDDMMLDYRLGRRPIDD